MGKIGQCCCDDCDCIEGLPPTLTISGYTGAGWTSSGLCCFRQEFTPNTPIISRYCSDVISRYEIEQLCERTFYILDNAGRACTGWTNDPNYDCDDQAADCCDPPTWVVLGTSSGKQKLTVETYHVAFNQLTLLVVYLRRDTVLCDGLPVCKWILILEYQISYASSRQASRRYDYSQTVTSDLACFSPQTEYVGECTHEEPIDCEDYGSLSDGCSIAGSVCVHRIKFFDTFPSGTHSFSGSDVPGLCAAPSSAGSCPSCEWDFSTTVCLEPGVYCAPVWCTDPPSIVSTPTTWTPTWSCGTINYVPPSGCEQLAPFGCESGFTRFCTPTDCTGPSITLDCDSVEWPQDDPDYEPPACDGCGGFSAGYPFSPLGDPLCGYGEGGPVRILCGCTTIQPFVQNVLCSGNPGPCNTACCYECFDCPGCPVCFNRYSFFLGTATVTVGSATTSFTITCTDLTAEPDYCFTPPSISMTIAALP